MFLWYASRSWKAYESYENRVALDGSQVICHMPPCKTYTAEGNYENVTRSISNHKSLDQDNTALMAVSKSQRVTMWSLVILVALSAN